MTDILTINHIVARTPEADGVTARVERIIRRVAEDRLERMLGAFPIAGQGDGQGEWCVPSVNVAAVLDLERPDSALEETVARAVLDAIADALQGSAVVHYGGTVDALTSLVVAAATHRFDDAWMWEQMGLVADADELSREPAACILRTLERRPECAVAAVMGAVRAVGFPAVHRLFADSGWIHLAGIVIDASAGALAGAALHAMLAGGASPVERPGDSQGAAVTTKPAPIELITASRIVTSSRLAGAARASRLRLSNQLLRALSVLTVAESEPAALCRSTAAPVCRALASVMSGAVAAVTEISWETADIRPRGRQQQAAAAPGTTVIAPGSEPRRDAEAGGDRQPPAGDLPPVGGGCRPADAEPNSGAIAAQYEPVMGAETAWAGLLFLLNVADGAGMPETLLTDPALDGIAAPELLARVALVLVPIPVDDPALFAFAGADPHRTRCTWDTPLAEPLADQIAIHAVAWAAAATQRLGREGDPVQWVAGMALRTGTIEQEPGWIDIHLDLQDVDIDIRRAGLDIDPGWVAWLGSVVRFRYV